jgi:acyl carrier protein
MPDYNDIFHLITQEITTLLEQKDNQANNISKNISKDTVLLDCGLDSLDLATLIVILEEKTKRDPFSEGFKNFTTLDELVNLYTDK